MGLSRLVIVNVGVMVVGRGVGFAAQLAVTMVLARIISVDAFGVIAICSVVMALGQVLSTAGVGAALVQREEVEQRHVDAAMAVTTFLAIATLGIALATSGWVTAAFDIGEYLPVYQVVCLTLALGALSSVGLSLLQRGYRFREVARVEVLSYVLGYGVPAVLLGFLGFDVWALAIAMVCQALVKMLMTHLLARRGTLLRLRGWEFDRRTLKELADFGTGYSIGILAGFFSAQGDYLVVGRHFSQSAVAYYTRAYQLIALPATFIGYALDIVLFPVLSRLQGQRRRLSVAYMAGISLAAVTFMPVSAAIAITADDMVAVLFGPKWSPVVPIVIALSFFTFFRMAYKISDSVARALGMVNELAGQKILYGVLVVGGALLGARSSVVAVAFWVGMAVLANYATLNFLVFRRLPWNLREFCAGHLRGIVLTAWVSLVLWVLHAHVLVGTGALVSLLVSWLAFGLVLLMALFAFPMQLLGRDSLEFILPACPDRFRGSPPFRYLERRMAS